MKNFKILIAIGIMGILLGASIVNIGFAAEENNKEIEEINELLEQARQIIINTAPKVTEIIINKDITGKFLENLAGFQLVSETEELMPGPEGEVRIIKTRIWEPLTTVTLKEYLAAVKFIEDIDDHHRTDFFISAPKGIYGIPMDARLKNKKGKTVTYEITIYTLKGPVRPVRKEFEFTLP